MFVRLERLRPRPLGRAKQAHTPSHNTEVLPLLLQLVVSSEMPKILIFTHMPYIGITFVYIAELVIRARQLDSVAQLVRALHWNHRAAGSMPARGPVVAFCATVPG